jgi:hypothetical protein
MQQTLHSFGRKLQNWEGLIYAWKCTTYKIPSSQSSLGQKFRACWKGPYIGKKFWSSWTWGWRDIIMFNVVLKAVGDSFCIALVSDVKFCHTLFQILEWSHVMISILHTGPLEKFSCLEFYIRFLFSQLLQSKCCLCRVSYSGHCCSPHFCVSQRGL